MYSFALPALQKSNVIYQFSCHCDSRYVGHTTHRLQDRIKQHVPKSIRSYSSQKRMLAARRCKSFTQTKTQFLASDSAVGHHFCKILSVLNIMMTVDFLFLPNAALLSLYLLLKLLLSKLLTPPSANKKDLCTAQRLYRNDALLLFFFSAIHGSAFSFK